jgi:ABC-2 type transport system ATP-binding protein
MTTAAGTDGPAEAPRPARTPASPRATSPRKPAAKSTAASKAVADGTKTDPAPTAKTSTAKAPAATTSTAKASAAKAPAAKRTTTPRASTARTTPATKRPAASQSPASQSATPRKAPAPRKPASRTPAAAAPVLDVPEVDDTRTGIAAVETTEPGASILDAPVGEEPAATDRATHNDEAPELEPDMAEDRADDTVTTAPVNEPAAEPTAAPAAEEPAEVAKDSAEAAEDEASQPEGPTATQAALAGATAWAKRVGSASQSRVTELRASLATARAARAAKLAEAEAIAELAKISEDPDVELPSEPSMNAPDAIVQGAVVELSDEQTAPRRPDDVVLSVTGLSKRFDDTVAVASIDLEVRAGDFYGIVGPNGAGKTTTLSMITGLLRPDSGSVIVHGTDVWEDPVAAKRQMGVLPDRLRLFDRLTGAQLLYYAGILRGLDAAVVRKRSADLAQAFGLEESMGRLVTDYSAGMTKKIALAAAMIHSPRMLVLDEPFESVDPVSAATVTEILKNYAAAGGTVVLSSHSMDMVQRMCDHVAVVVNGQILADGTIDEVRDGKSLEERFIELTGGEEVSEGLQWLHSFSN